MAKSNKKRQNRPSDVAADKKRVKTHNWEKDDTEVDLEAKLFGTTRVSGKGKGKGKGGKKSQDGDTGLGQVDDDDVSVQRIWTRAINGARVPLICSCSRWMRLWSMCCLQKMKRRTRI
jgi:hypothetical protein